MPGVAVNVIPQNNLADWPVRSIVRFVGVVTHYDSVMLTVLGHVHRWTACPEVVPADWPTMESTTRRWPWSAPTTVKVPLARAWRADEGGPVQCSFPVGAVAIFFPKVDSDAS